ncbi:MAG: transposase, partial [Piscirickettsiaceae bacterium CG18_big_fil_WC_8_21_14_2_50_44_103]
MKKIIRKAFKFRLNTNSDQAQKMLEFSGVNRFVWNKALSMNLYRLENKQPILWYQEMAYWLGLWKSSDEYGFLKTVHSQTLQQTLKNLERAFKDAFDKKQPLKRIPKFKKKGLSDSFRYPQGFKLEQTSKRVFLPKIGWVKYRNSRQVIGDVKNMSISRKGKYWYVSIQTEYETEILRHESNSIIGIDMGVKRFFTLSDGSYIEPLNSFRKLSKKLAFEQRKLSKKVRFSANWKKQKLKINRLYEHIANARLDFLHKTSTKISK